MYVLKHLLLIYVVSSTSMLRWNLKRYARAMCHIYSEFRILNYPRNMMRNIKNQHPCPENFERYRVWRNKCVKAKVKSQRKYFGERCDGGPTNQHFCPTIKPFINSRYDIKENVILREGDVIINNRESVVKIFNEYFNQIASDIGFNDPVPDNYAAADVLLSFIAKYTKHPSIIAIKSAVHEYGIFEYQYDFCCHWLKYPWLFPSKILLIFK